MANDWLDTEAFWQFSCEIYQRKGVKELCLQCQDELGLNVNLLLFCALLMRFDVSLTESQWRIVRQAISSSESELQKLRKERMNLVKNSEGYKACLQNELQLEAQQQRLIIHAATGLELNESRQQPLTTYFAAVACGDQSIREALNSVFKEDNRESEH